MPDLPAKVLSTRSIRFHATAAAFCTVWSPGMWTLHVVYQKMIAWQQVIFLFELWLADSGDW